MKIKCACGAMIHDAGDGLPHKAHVIPDSAWFPLMEAVDELLLKRCATSMQRETACTHVRALLVKAARVGWQCSGCGRLYMDDAGQRSSVYAPEGGASRSIFTG